MLIRDIIYKCQKENPCDIDIRYDEPMSLHTTFKVGGPADCRLCPKGDGFTAFCAGLLRNAQKAGVPVFVLGGGANIVVSDKGIRGIVLDMTEWKGEIADGGNFAALGALCNEVSRANKRADTSLVFRSGTTMDEAAERAAAAGLAGLEFLAGMPGTIGGAVYMNARCYGSEIADVLGWTETIWEEGNLKIVEYMQKEEFGYKRSPFQGRSCLIVSASFDLKRGNKDDILNKMKMNRQDRKAKGHYDFPCAGSAFKNNRDFGKSTGQIIDELGLKGLSIGGAQIAPFHGNIIINRGGATAADIKALMSEVASRVKTVTGFVLEPEIIFVGG